MPRTTTPRSMPPPQIGALLRMAWEALHAELVDGLVAAGFDDLRAVHRPLLRYVLTEGLRPADLAEQLDLSKQAINDLLRDFESKGYIILEPDPADGRAKRTRLTDRGWDLALTASNLSRSVGERWADDVGADRYARFEETLREIVEAERLRART